MTLEWPNSPEAERGLLGSVMLNGNLAGELNVDLFHDLRHVALVKLIAKMASNGEPIDATTVASRVHGSGLAQSMGGLDYVASLPDATASAAQWDYWLDILIGKAQLRRVITASYDAMTEAQKAGADANHVVEAFERAAIEVRGCAVGGDEVDVRSTIREVIDDLQVAHEKPGKLRGLATGFHDLDSMLGGLKEQQLIIIAARPSVGKTSLAMNIAERVAVDDQLPVGVFSLEMAGKELLYRMACCRARVDSQLGYEGRLTEGDVSRLTTANAKIARAPLHLCERGALPVPRLAGIARRMKQKHDIRLIVVDYLGLLRTGEKSRGLYEDISTVSTAMKGIAKELNIPAVVLAQLNRGVEKENRRPRLSDLRDSGSIEQDADIVAFIHKDPEQNGEVQQCDLVVAKHRNGPTGIVKLQFHRRFTRFESVSRVGGEK